MRTYIISRHSAAIAWLGSLGHDITGVIPHLDQVMLQSGDLVIGNLPVHLIAEINRQGARYLHISMDVPACSRGRELDVAEMASFNAQLHEFHVEHKHA